MNWVTIKTYDNPVLAEIDKSALESAGIKTFLFNTSLVSGTGINMMFDGIKLRVQKENAEEAMALLDEPETFVEGDS